MTKMSKIINERETTIIFDNKFVSEDPKFIDLFENLKSKLDFNKCKFGTFNLKINKVIDDKVIDDNVIDDNNVKNKKQKNHYVFTVDCSGSMSDLCNDNRSKMDHIIHTIINMIIYFAKNPHLNVSITIFAFDDIIYKIVENIIVTKENLDETIEKVKQIHPKNQTNIEKALINAKEYILEYYQQQLDTSDATSDANNNSNDDKKNYVINHIFMTDGDATIGNNVPEELKNIIDIRFDNLSLSTIFIGFGVDHNAYLLKTLSSEINTAYYFVDALEKAGLVYGEILHSMIFKVLENTTITVTNGYIYDWKNNVWDNKIVVGDLISDTNKIFHVLSDKQSDFTCVIHSNYCSSRDNFEFTIRSSDNIERNEDLTKYKYRQETQQLLFDVNVHNFTKNKFRELTFDYRLHEDEIKKNRLYENQLKIKMNVLLNKMKDYNTNNNETIEDKKFMKMLCDDIYICLQTFDTRYGAMFSCARQTSQGAQRSYSATYTPELRRNNIFIGRNFAINNTFDEYEASNEEHIDFQLNTQPLTLKRSFCNTRSTHSYDNLHHLPRLHDLSDNDEDEDGINNYSKIPPFPTIYSDNCDENLENYVVSDQIDNPYSTHSILSVMRSCSTNMD